ncbi:adhesion G-protein coupled receptor G5 isoform X1 [Struthio camelus]|uniref:adhesion G-protein coupled receptor G5 isoform X1 n=1 Tax=Struthio camelus TaxID=8801 RepID=UPI003603B78A
MPLAGVTRALGAPTAMAGASASASSSWARVWQGWASRGQCRPLSSSSGWLGSELGNRPKCLGSAVLATGRSCAKGAGSRCCAGPARPGDGDGNRCPCGSPHVSAKLPPPRQAQNRKQTEIRVQHAMYFPAELMQDIQAREVEQKLVCIYIHSPCIFQDARNSSVLNDNILGAFLPKVYVTNLPQPVEIQFQHDKVLDTSNATCVSWLQGAGSGDLGSWSSEGCETRHSQGTVLYRCNHLTYFAVLLITPGNISQAELVSLTYISIVGCSISAAASLFTVLLCCIFRRKKSDDTTKIHMNLLGALFLLNSGFLLSEPLALASEGLCRAAAAFLHGCLLCTLAWMAAEAFHLYLLLIKVYNIYVRHYLLKLCLFGWGLPALAVISILLFKRDAYGCLDIKTTDGYKNATMCWLTSRAAHYSTLCYAGLILLFNTLVLLTVVRMLRSSQRQKETARKDWATVLGLTCLLGTTWGVAFFSFDVVFVPQVYLFTLFNSLQGLFISLWYLTVHCRMDCGFASTTSTTTR